MSKNKINQTGTGNFAFSDIHNSEFNIFIGKSLHYKELLEQLATQEKLLSRTPEDETEERLGILKRIDAFKEVIEQFKRDVLQLAEQFNRIEINTDRLQRAKKFFDKGEFSEAQAVLETELEQMKDEQARLLIKRDEYETDVLPKLKSSAEQFFVLALLTQLDYSKKGWFTDTCQYYELSIKSCPTKYNIFEYALFLWKHNDLMKSEKYWRQFLNDFAAEISLPEKARALNNLGLLQWDSNEHQKGLDYCEEAFKIYSELLKDNPSTYLPEQAGTLNNIAMFHSELGEHSKAEKEYEEVLEIYRKLARTSPSNFRLFEIGKMLGNLGCIYTETKKYEKALAALQESLGIYKQLSGKFDVLFFVATSLHNLGVLYCAEKNYKESIEAYEAALNIRMKLAEHNPMVYIPEASCTLANLAFVYAKVPNPEKSIEYALTTLAVLIPVYKKVPFTQHYMENALNILKGWGLSHEEIDQMLAEGRLIEKPSHFLED